MLKYKIKKGRRRRKNSGCWLDLGKKKKERKRRKIPILSGRVVSPQSASERNVTSEGSVKVSGTDLAKTGNGTPRTLEITESKSWWKTKIFPMHQLEEETK